MIYLFHGNQNIQNVIAIKHFKQKDLTILKNPSQIFESSLEAFAQYLVHEGFAVQTRAYNPYDQEDVENLAQALLIEDVFVIPSIGYAYTANLAMAYQSLCTLCYVEEDGDVFISREGRLVEVPSNNVALDVYDYIENFGGFVAHSNESFFDDPTSIELVDLILENLSIYQKIMRPLPIKRHPVNPNKSIIDMRRFSKHPDEKKLINQMFKTLVKRNKCEVLIKSNHYVLHFHDVRFKEYFAKAGSWLEALTYRLIKRMKEIDNPMSSIKFHWSKGEQSTINEIDVLAIYDNQLVMISCKDTIKHSDTTLYELYTHGEKLAYDSIRRILITTTAPNYSYQKRAKNLGIHIVAYTNSINALYEDLKYAILTPQIT